MSSSSAQCETAAGQAAPSAVSTPAAPDSWESHVDDGEATSAPTAKFSTLNVNAVEFVPSFSMPATNSSSCACPETSSPVANGAEQSIVQESITDAKERSISPPVDSKESVEEVTIPPDGTPKSTPVREPCSVNNVELGQGIVNKPLEEDDTVMVVEIQDDVGFVEEAKEAMEEVADEVATEAEDASLSSPSEAAPSVPEPMVIIDDGGTWEDGLEDDGETIITPEGDDEEPSSEETPAKMPKKKCVKEEVPAEKKEHVNVVFIGHVDAGKSTIGGQIMALTGMVDKRTLEKYEREAREKSRESWYLSWALDTNQEERDKGKTVEVGRAFFETDRKHFTILDAPGHKSFVPNMIGGAAQADLAVLVISARKGEFETGFDRGGQTREHAMLAKTAGVKFLVVLVNKMDDPTVNWDEVRYQECKDKILPYLKKLGFNLSKDLFFLPCSGQTGQGIKEPLDEKVCPWFRGPAFIPFIDDLPSLNRKNDGPFIMPIVDKYKDMGTVVMGKVESGECKKGQSLIIMPNRTPVTVDMLWSDDDEVNRVVSGENVKIKVKGVEEEDVSPGFVICDASNPIHTGRIFDAQLVIMEHKSIICAGYSAVMHIHCAAEEVTVKALICLVDRKTGDKSKTRPRFVKQDQVAIMRIECAGVICVEPFKSFPQMGRFTLRDENKTIAIGKVLKLVE